MNRTYDVKPIPTEFNGVKYKSRLEARWALFFNLLHIEAFYEYEGYQLLSGWYLPDFYVPSMNAFFEVKPNELTDRETQLCYELNEATGKRVIQLAGDFGYRDINEQHGYNCDGDVDYLFCACPICGKLGVEYCGRGERICGKKCVPNQWKHNTSDDIRLFGTFGYVSKYQFEYQRKQSTPPVVAQDPTESRRQHIKLLEMVYRYNEGKETK